MEKLFEKKVNINAVNDVSRGRKCDSDRCKGVLGLHRSTEIKIKMIVLNEMWEICLVGIPECLH